jgi:4-diphosphocytidyl-2-C-methyl-D-erythritol kinase
MVQSRPSLTLPAPAKVNLHLEILGRRPDGFHNLRMINLLLDLCDTIHLQLKPSGLRILCRHPQVPSDRTNLAAKAAELLLQQIPEPRPGVRISIRKRIPVAAGLGGGSSDAAATLRGLVRLWRLSFSEARLRRLALAVGADVPFFLFGRPALVEGIGERLKPLPPIPDWTYLLVTPPFGVSTAWAYGRWQASLTKRPKLHIIKNLKNSGHLELSRWLRNDLEPVVVRRYPVVGEVRQALVSLGALAAVMTGSGPSVVGVFKNLHQAGKASKSIRQHFPACRAVVTRRWRAP